MTKKIQRDYNYNYYQIFFIIIPVMNAIAETIAN